MEDFPVRVEVVPSGGLYTGMLGLCIEYCLLVLWSVCIELW